MAMSTSLKTLEEILAQARRLPEAQRQRLVADLQADNSAPPSESRRRNAMKRWLARAGSGHAAKAANVLTQEESHERDG